MELFKSPDSDDAAMKHPVECPYCHQMFSYGLGKYLQPDGKWFSTGVTCPHCQQDSKWNRRALHSIEALLALVVLSLVWLASKWLAMYYGLPLHFALVVSLIAVIAAGILFFYISWQHRLRFMSLIPK